MLAPEASELVAAVLQRSQAAAAALDAQDPERPNFEAFVQGARRALPRCAGKRRSHPCLILRDLGSAPLRSWYTMGARFVVAWAGDA